MNALLADIRASKAEKEARSEGAQGSMPGVTSNPDSEAPDNNTPGEGVTATVELSEPEPGPTEPAEELEPGVTETVEITLPPFEKAAKPQGSPRRVYPWEKDRETPEWMKKFEQIVQKSPKTEDAARRGVDDEAIEGAKAGKEKPAKDAEPQTLNENEDTGDQTASPAPQAEPPHGAEPKVAEGHGGSDDHAVSTVPQEVSNQKEQAERQGDEATHLRSSEVVEQGAIPPAEGSDEPTEGVVVEEIVEVGPNSNSEEVVVTTVASVPDRNIMVVENDEVVAVSEDTSLEDGIGVEVEVEVTKTVTLEDGVEVEEVVEFGISNPDIPEQVEQDNEEGDEAEKASNALSVPGEVRRIEYDQDPSEYDEAHEIDAPFQPSSSSSSSESELQGITEVDEEVTGALDQIGRYDEEEIVFETVSTDDDQLDDDIVDSYHQRDNDHTTAVASATSNPNDDEYLHSHPTPSIKKEDVPPERSPAFVDGSNDLDNVVVEKEETKGFVSYVVLFGICILIAVVVVLVVFSQLDNDKKPSFEVPFSSPPTGFLRTPAPTKTPGPQPPPPTPTLLPPSSPSEAPFSTPPPQVPPTDTPVSTLSPTSAPTPAPDPPGNDLCVDAIGPLSSEDSIFGTISFATAEALDTCGDITSNGPGVWYHVLGTGGEMLAHTCLNTNFDSKITIFKGDCDIPECYEFSDDFCGSQSAVSWESTYRQEYRILVHGAADFAGDGSFQLTITAKKNNACSTAIGPLGVNNQEAVAGNTQIIGSPNNKLSCEGEANSSPGAFYLVRGTGGDMAASLCDGTNFNARLTILSGDCSNLQCLAQSSACQVIWASEPFQEYYVMIDGQSASDVGDFGLRIISSTLPSNNACHNALPLQPDGMTVRGSTAAAAPDTDAPFCLSTVTAPGVWFFVTGDGSTLQASLCHGATFDTRLSVYEGECTVQGGLGELLCIDGNDDFCGQESLVSWDSEPGKDYYILVHGYEQGSGDFEISVTSLGLGI